VSYDRAVTEPAAVPVRRKRIRLLVGAAAVVAVAAGVGLWVGLGGGGAAHAIRPVALPERAVCADQVRIDVTSDQRMRAIASAVAGDSQVKAVYTVTREQAVRIFRDEFADEPDLGALARPEALPASVVVIPVDGVDVNRMAAGYRTRFTDARQIQAAAAVDVPGCAH
jgi:cell division protein FtsX